VTHWRLLLAAAGSGLLAIVILFAGMTAIVPGLRGIAGPLVQTVSVLAALTYYIGFAPPRWLRQAWQLSELQRFLREMAGRSAGQRAAAAPEYLCQTGTRVVDGLAALVAIWDETRQRLEIQASTSKPALSGPIAAGEGAIGRAWRERRPVAAATPADFGPDDAPLTAAIEAGALLAVPIATQEHSWGLLIVFLGRGPLFVSDDLNLLGLLAEQGAIALDYAGLLAEQQALIEQLRQRTAELETANKELEAFSYSVSHDLRTPLRGINGFSQALLEDYADQLDHTGRSYLQRVRAAAVNMGQLIDDLLGLAQITRSELHREPVDMSALAREVASALQQRDPERQVAFAIGERLAARGDRRLLRVLLENLIGNAWKFTSKRPRASIAFGAACHDGTTVYFVRDDGDGFDMAYAHKLFGAFQRLHAMAEFEGTGIGLATVHRIVHRHGGRVWAEGAVGQGATFYFTLG
jgi:signal transduction histidine kinase